MRATLLCLLEHDDLIPLHFKFLQQNIDILTVLPGHVILRVERRLRDHIIGRVAGNTADPDLPNASAIAGTKDRTDIVKASDIIENNNKR